MNVSGVKMSELVEKRAVNTKNGRDLGRIRDIEIDPSDGRVISLSVEKRRTLFGIFGSEKRNVPWENVILIGEDAILVDAGNFAENEGAGKKSLFDLFE